MPYLYITIKRARKTKSKGKSFVYGFFSSSTSTLEVQGLEEDSLNKIIDKFEKEFLVGQYRNRLWVE